MQLRATPKIPESVLVIVHTLALDVLIIERADPSVWQSVTGSKATLDEPLRRVCGVNLRERGSQGRLNNSMI